MTREAFAAVGVFCLICLPGQVQCQQEPITQLVSARSLECLFGPGTVAEWKAQRFTISQDLWKGDTHFDSIDPKGGKARLIGNQGATDVLVLPSSSGLTFVEATSAGNFSFTTVYASHCGAAGIFSAVMSRHMNLLGEPLSSQYHGTCKILQ